MLKRENITGLILAGGAGRRVNNLDKGMLKFRNKLMVEHQIDWLAPQVTRVLISANRNLESYQSYGHQVITDGKVDYNGPLQGIYKGLLHCKTSHLFVLPVDMPNLPNNLIKQLLEKVNAITSQTDTIENAGFYLKSKEREHFLSLLIARSKLAELAMFLDKEKSRVGEFLAFANISALDLGLAEQYFDNYNHPDDYLK